ncbi:hypothetical protein Leryth_016407 [Lithospermum erythrorhizon]|nr:hypothetical protein Leryth_016407 [Lithospermum erythrorhizon]
MATPPKKKVFPFLIFILLLPTIFIVISLYPPPPLPTYFPLPSNSKFTLTIKLLTFNRLPALSRCLHSLSAARYDHDTVHLHIYLDHFNVSSIGSSKIDQKRRVSMEILDFLDGFKWDHGQKMVHYRTGNVGLQAQWLEAWWPTSDDEFAFVVEDDLQLSPLYYRFLKGLIMNYYYNESNFSPMVYGASLQRPRFVPGKHGNKIQLDSDTHLFLYQLVGTWGQLLFPKPWKEFRLWYDDHKAKNIRPILDGMVTTGWYKKMGDKIWTPWFIKFIHSRGYFNIYTNFLGERALSVSHRDAGVNYGKTVGPDSNLVDETSTDLNLVNLPPLNHLKWYDYCFKEVLPNRIIKSSNEFGLIVQSLQHSDTILLVSVYGASESILMNLLCHFQKLNIFNYILLGPKSDFIVDLARRGHPVIDADQLFEHIGHQKLLKTKKSSVELTREFMVKAFAIKKCLELGYTTWIFHANIIPLADDSFANFVDPSKDFLVSETSKLLCVRSSPSSKKIWVDDFVYKVVAIAESSRSKDSSSIGENFVSTIKQLLQQMSIKLGLLDDAHFVLNGDDIHGNQTFSRNMEKVVSWPPKMNSDMIKKKLVNFDMWAVDDELSCSAVVCHKS